MRIAFFGGRDRSDALPHAERAMRARLKRDNVDVSLLGTSLVLRIPASKAGDSSFATLRTIGEEILAAVEAGIGERPWVGIGGTHKHRESVDAGAREAMQAIELARSMWKTPRTVLYEDVLPFAALSADPALCNRLGHVLDPVASHDRRHGTSMMPTLQACIDENWSAAATARRLDIHRHTVEYRLQQLRRILGYDVRRSADRFVLEAAAVARRLRH